MHEHYEMWLICAVAMEIAEPVSFLHDRYDNLLQEQDDRKNILISTPSTLGVIWLKT
jgi:hypothetical protein